MNDEQQIRGELTRLAADDPLGPIDSARLVDRGRRGKRRRRILASGGAVAAVSAVALTAAQLPGLGSALDLNDQPSVAASPTPSGDATKKPVPYPPGEVVTEAEALKRCRAQWSKDAGVEIPPIHVLSSQPIGNGPNRRYKVHMPMLVDYDDKPGAYRCDIPARGEDLPGQILAAAPPIRQDPALKAESDAEDATVLAACTAQLKALTPVGHGRGIPGPDRGKFKPPATDLTGWRIVARASLRNVGTRFVALSPARDLVAHCDVGEAGGASSETNVFRTTPAPKTLSGSLFNVGSMNFMGVPGWMYSDAGRVPTNIVRLHVVAKNGRSVDLPVNDGWFAIKWSDGDPNGQPTARYTAYDADGKVVARG